MLRKTKFQKATQSDWFDWCRSLLELYDTDKHFLSGSRISNVNHLRMHRWILGHNFEGKDLLLRNMLLDAMLSADVKCPGSGVYVPWFIYNCSNSSPTRESSLDYLEKTLAFTKSDFVKEIFENVYQTVGPLTKIIIKTSYESDAVIKYRNSFRFPLALDAQFHRMIGNVEHIELTNPIVIMIEGAPETVGEINNLLQWNNNTGRPVLLVARSFPEEISATLGTNWLKNTLNVLPVPYGDKIESINLAADLCAITKGELISAHFGDVIASSVLNEDKWGTVDKLEWSSTGLSLTKDVDVSRHASSLLEKLKSIKEEELQNIYRDRILSLSNDAVEVWINKEDDKSLEELDALIKHYNGYVVSGTIETDIGPLPRCFVDAATETAQSLRQEILNIGGFLVGVNDEMVAR